MKNFNYFTESYETIRRTLRELFVYGCYDSSISAERQKISDRKYSDELKRIRYFWSKYISARRSGRKYFFWRLDNISNVRLLEQTDTENLLSENFCHYIWNASLPKTAQSPCLVEIDFKVLDEELHFLKRLEAEKRFGTIKVVDKNHYLFSIELLDPNELIPWIRSFGHVASVRMSSQHNLREKLNGEWAELLKNPYASNIFRTEQADLYSVPKIFPK